VHFTGFISVTCRCEFQKYDSLRQTLFMSEADWRARYPLAQQLAELQAAAAGVEAWESLLAVKPAGEARWCDL
jgi:cytochrome c-type biogenesis protein CcmH/NrfG